MRLLKQSDTTKVIPFLLVDATDHITGKTGLSPIVTISKNGASFGAPSGSVAEIGNGWYKLTPAATDLGTVGPLLLHATAAGADPVDVEYQVVPFDPYDSDGLGLSRIDAAISSRLASAAYTAPDNTKIGEIKTQTDKLKFEGDDVKATLDGELVKVDGTVQTLDDLAATLTTAHGEGSWTTATGFAVPGSAMALTTEAVQAVDAELTAKHGSGEWKTATGFAVAGDAMGLKTEAVDAIETKLKTTHGEGSWTTATGFAIPGDEMALKAEAVEAISEKLKEEHGTGSWTITEDMMQQMAYEIAAEIPDPLTAAVPGAYELGTAGRAIGEIKEQAARAQFDEEDRILASAEVTVTNVTLSDEAVDAIWNEPRGEERPEGSFGNYLDKRISEVKATAVVQPLAGRIQTPVGDGGELVLYQHDRVRCSWVVDRDLQGHELYLLFFSPWTPNVAVSTIPPSCVTIEENTITVDAPDTYMPPVGVYGWALRDQTLDGVILAGKAIVRPAPDVEEEEE